MNNNLRNKFHFFINSRKGQILRRLYSNIKRPYSHKRIMKKKLNYTPILKYKIFPNNYFYNFDVENILNNKFIFLNNQVYFKKEKDICWDSVNHSDLFNFNLNYFDYLNALKNDYKINKNIIVLEKGLDLIDNWISKSITYNRIMWAPYTTSLRLVNWLDFIMFVKSIDDFKDENFTEIKSSIYKQYIYLSKNLETDIRGNHLFENLKTLILCDLVFDRKKSFKKHVSLLIKQLDEQILDDGCHFEKSISYHIIVFEGLLSIVEWFKVFEVPDNKSVIKIKEKLGKMYSFYNYIGANEKRYPLLNDSNYTMTNHIKNINERYVKLELSKSKYNMSNDSGYIVFNKNDIRMTIDVGTLGPNYLLGHSHNDIFNYTLSINGTSIATDTGVFEYEIGDWRDYSRSVKAHNTVQVNQLEQSDIWKSFRVGRRPKKVQIIKKEINPFLDIEASYNSIYSGKNSYVHIRRFKDLNQNIIIMDRIINKESKESNSYVHLDPDINLKVINNRLLSMHKNEKIVTYIHIFGSTFVNVVNGNDDPIQGWYFPEFGVKKPRNTIVITSKTEKDLIFGYVFSKNKDVQIELIDKGIKIDNKYLYIGERKE